MRTRHDELRDELVAVLGAGRELDADTDRQLAEAFILYLERQDERGADVAVPAEVVHQPHYSLLLAGGAWGATLMFLFLLAVLDKPSAGDFVIASVLILSLLVAAVRAFLYMARTGWQLPRVRVTLASPGRRAPRRG